MSVHGKFKREDNTTAVADLPDLRSQLVAQLMKLAQEGNVQAIRELLDRPSLLEESQPEPKLTLAQQKEQIRQFLLKLREREIAADADYWLHAFERVIADRLEHEGRTLVFRRWQVLSAELKAQLWADIVETLAGEDWDVVAEAQESIQ